VHDELMANAHNAIARTLDAALAPCIKPRPLLMVIAIDLDDELYGVRTEVNDVLSDNDLAAKPHLTGATLRKPPTVSQVAAVING